MIEVIVSYGKTRLLQAIVVCSKCRLSKQGSSNLDLVKMASKLSIGQMKALKQSGRLKEAPSADEHAHGHDGHEQPQAKFAPVPMFLPTETFGRNVVNVQTRQSFLTPNIGWWVRWRVTRFAAIAAAILAVLLLFVNGILAAVAGLAAGYLYGQHIWADFYINHMLKSRRLLETT